MKLQHKFVEFMPDTISEGVIFISLEYNTAIHRCACGCGNEIVTPLSPKDWQLLYNGQSISLHPSIGNWRYPCKSHYWIRNNSIQWAESWDEYRKNQSLRKRSEPIKKASLIDKILSFFK